MSEAPPQPPAEDPLGALAQQVAGLASGLAELSARIDGETERAKERDALLMRVLNVIYDDDPGNRRRLSALRADPSYERAFSTPDPLVSVVIPTWNRAETLVDRAIASALAQTHANIEVIVVGDNSPPEVAAAVAAMGDARVSFHNLTVRGPYDPDPGRAWLASGTPGVNAGVELAEGLWIAPLGDDDAFVPDHIERLLGAARERHLEFVYGRIRYSFPDGRNGVIGEFPPRAERFGLQASLYHAGLRFMHLELAHALFDKPNDWGLAERLMRIGVRIGMVEEISVDYWPSMRALDRATATAEPAQELSRERDAAAQLAAQVEDLSRRLDEVRRSRSWRLTAPLRRMRGR